MSYVGPYGYQYGMPVQGYPYVQTSPAYVPNPEYRQPVQQMQQPVEQNPINGDIPKVSGKEGALGLGNKLGKNKSVIAIDISKEDIEWLIVTDETGLPTVKPLRFTDMDDEPEVVQEEKTEQYVTKREFDALCSKVNALLNDLGGVK